MPGHYLFSKMLPSMERLASLPVPGPAAASAAVKARFSLFAEGWEMDVHTPPGPLFG